MGTFLIKFFIIYFRGTKEKCNEKITAQGKRGTGEYLIPELCNFIDFPSDYYLKAFALPCILHRLKDLLIAEQLRSVIAKECNFSSKANFKPLTINKSNTNSILESSLESSINDEEESSMDILMQKLSGKDGNKIFLVLVK